MGNRKSQILLSSLLAFFLAASVAFGASEDGAKSSEKFRVPKFPVIGAFEGSSEIRTGKPEAVVKPKKNLLIREKGLITTGANAYLRIDLSETDSVFIWPNTKFDLLAIDFEKGTVESMYLHEGKVRVLIASEGVRLLQSPLHSDSLSRGDYLFHMSVKEARLGVDVLKGSLSFRGLEAESYVALHERDSTLFQGVLENSEIAYDVLMHGKKVAKGNVGKVTKLKESDMKALTAKLRTLEKTYVVPKSQRPPPPDPLLICKSPSARFDQCSWVCEGMAKGSKACKPGTGVRCVRKRCSAQGQWVEPYELRAQEWKCEPHPIVTKCDY